MIEEIKNYYNLQDCIKKYGDDVDDVGLWESEKYIISKYINPNDKILDIGCGAGRTTINLFKNGFKNVVGIDIANNLLDFARNYCKENELDIKFFEQSATEIQFDKETFDSAIFSYNGFMCIPLEENRRRALSEIHRVLKPKGIFIFSAHDRDNPRFSAFWQEEEERWAKGEQNTKYDKFGDRFLPDEFGKESYIHIPSKNEVRALCEEAGFTIIESVNNLEIGAPEEKNRETIFWVVQKN